MNIKKEIEKYARDEDKPVLLWLFERYHLASQVAYFLYEPDSQKLKLTGIKEN